MLRFVFVVAEEVVAEQMYVGGSKDRGPVEGAP